MNLPPSLKAALEEQAQRLGIQELSQASQQLSQRYRNQKQREEILQNKERFVSNEAQRMAYLLARLPATYEAVHFVLNEVKNRYSPDFHSVLDIGAGPGTVMWAASEVFPRAREMASWEQDSALITLGKKLATHSSHPFIRHAHWQQANVLKQESFPESDLITVSYAMGEWPQQALTEIIPKLWASAKQALVIIEPGTMNGFAVIRQVRQQLIDLGAHMVAPCPHMLACPMPADDWCHFSVRIERSRLHKQMKGGSLGHEDEKFSYVAFAKQKVDLPEARILRHPMKHSGHVSLFLCTKDKGLQKKIISRKDGELYKEARDLEWGQELDVKSNK
jgi:ribosomal protein RSM22 (predicted rRNA methylase)